MIKHLLFSAVLSLASALPISPAAAGVDDLARNAQVDVLSGWRDASGQHVAALRVRLAPGWKTYWRAPGEGGIPPRFSWAGSRNIKSVGFHWPVPEVFDQNGMQSIGYKHELILPILIAPRNAGAPIAMRGEVEIGVCLDICMPLTVRLSADLPAGGARDPKITAALANRPATQAEAGVRRVTCSAEPIRDGLRFSADVTMPALGHDEVAVVELSDQTVWIAPTMTQRTGGQLLASTEMVPANAAPFLLDRSDVRITVLGKGRAVDIQGCAAG